LTNSTPIDELKKIILNFFPTFNIEKKLYAGWTRVVIVTVFWKQKKANRFGSFLFKKITENRLASHSAGGIT